MPVVELSYRRLSDLAGAPVRDVRESLPYLGLDVEGEDGDAVRVEYSPNRPDYSTEFGVSLGLQGVLGVRTGLYGLAVRDSDRRLAAGEGVLRVRPRVSGIAAVGGSLDGRTIRQIISMQEDLHQGIGRGRSRVAIGLHDMDKLRFPLEYALRDRDFGFAPLGSAERMSVDDIMENTEQGRAYGGLLPPGPVPVILDAGGNAASMPPVINSDRTAVTGSTRNVLVDVTGHDAVRVENALAVVCVTLQAAGFSLERLHVSGAGNRTPDLSAREVGMDRSLPGRVLGLDLGPERTVECLLKSRLGARADGDRIVCTVPPYRFDILGGADLVEEVALGYGVQNMEPTLPCTSLTGRPSAVSRNLRYVDRMMTGLGYTEALNPSLVGARTAERCGFVPDYMAAVSNPKSQNHTLLRNSVLPGLLENLASNIHEPYPQRLYETGAVFLDADGGMSEPLHLACITAHGRASYSEIKSVLGAVCGDLGLGVRTPPLDAAPFSKGRAAAVLVSGVGAGAVGEISDAVRASFRIREGVAAAAFEVDLGLIFELCAGGAAPHGGRADGRG